jgi:hypothetical protein
MFLAFLCLLTLALFLTKHQPDQYGWMMLMGLAWLCGYLDCRRFGKSDQDSDRVMPRDAIGEAPPTDETLFQK